MVIWKGHTLAIREFGSLPPGLWLHAALSASVSSSPPALILPDPAAASFARPSNFWGQCEWFAVCCCPDSVLLVSQGCEQLVPKSCPCVLAHYSDTLTSAYTFLSSEAAEREHGSFLCSRYVSVLCCKPSSTRIWTTLNNCNSNSNNKCSTLNVYSVVVYRSLGICVLLWSA